jgi:hypothetical protein
MKIYHTVPSTELELKKIICDSCKKEYMDEFEIQEFISIDKECGYGSIFGDENVLKIDLCQYCVKKHFGSLLTIFQKNEIY